MGIPRNEGVSSQLKKQVNGLVGESYTQQTEKQRSSDIV